MALLARKKLLLAKTETVYGTDVTPTGAANAIQTSNLTITPLAGPVVSRDLDRPTLGNDLQIQVGQFVQLSFMVEVAGSSGAGTAPPWGPLVEACGFSETISAGVSTTYAPESSPFESVTMYFHHDGQKHMLTGARGTFSMDMSAGGIPHFNFTFTGLYNTPTSTADATPTLTAFQVPKAVNDTNTTTFTLHTIACNMISAAFDMACNVVYRNVVGSETVEIVDRAPAGQLVFEAPTITTKNWFTTALASTTGALSMVHGTAAGNIVTIAAPNTQIISPTYGESDGISTIQCGLSFVPGSSGNDEFTIVCT
jgi:Phage tail tube protein